MFLNKEQFKILNDSIDDIRRTIRSNYFNSEDKAFSRHTSITEKLNALIQRLEELGSLVSDVQKDTIHIQTKQEERNVEVNFLERQLQNKQKEIDALREENILLRQSIESLDASFSAVCQGVFNHDNIEFAGVKTYRDGWKYLYHNGTQLTDFSNIKRIYFDWYAGEYSNLEVTTERR